MNSTPEERNLTPEERESIRAHIAICNPEFELSMTEAKGCIQSFVSKITDIVRTMTSKADYLKSRGQLNHYNMEDFIKNRIPEDEFQKRNQEDIALIEAMNDKVIEDNKDIMLLGEMLSLMIRRPWFDDSSPISSSEEEAVPLDILPEETSQEVPKARPKTFHVKCLVNECEHCILKWEQNNIAGNREENESQHFCLNVCVWCNQARRLRKIKLFNAAQAVETGFDAVGTGTNVVQTMGTGTNVVQIIGTGGNVVQTVGAKSKRSKVVPTETIAPTPFIYVNPNVVLADKYFYVLLTAPFEDGSIDYLQQILSKNFRQMFPPSYRAIANIFTFNVVDEDKLYLYGLIRYDHRNKYNITPKSSHIKNDIRSEMTGIKTMRSYNIENLTKYIGRCFETNRETITTKYNYIVSHPPTFGDSLGAFL